MFEKLKFDQLYSVFLPVLSDNMSGFLRGRSYFYALLKLTDDWHQALDKKKKEWGMGKSQYPYNLFIDDKSIEIEPTLEILSVTLEQDLSFKSHVAIMLKKSVCK